MKSHTIFSVLIGVPTVLQIRLFWNLSLFSTIEEENDELFDMPHEDTKRIPLVVIPPSSSCANNASYGTPCDDGNQSTIFDVCDGFGGCYGVTDKYVDEKPYVVCRWDGTGNKPNLGDTFGDILIPPLSGRRVVNRCAKDTDYYLIGSDAHNKKKIDPSRVHICGYGAKLEMAKWKDGTPFCPQHVHSFRGPQTREFLIEHRHCEESTLPDVFGDVAFMLPFVYQPPSVPPAEQRKDVCILPHINDILFSRKGDVPSVANLMRMFLVNETDDVWYGGLRNDTIDFDGTSVRLVDIRTNDIKYFIDAIVSHCSRVVSATLHGIIIAHVYGIPGTFLRFEHSTNRNTNIKYQDFFRSIGCNTVREPLTIQADESVVNYIPRILNAPSDTTACDGDNLVDTCTIIRKACPFCDDEVRQRLELAYCQSDVDQPYTHRRRSRKDHNILPRSVETSSTNKAIIKETINDSINIEEHALFFNTSIPKNKRYYDQVQAAYLPYTQAAFNGTCHVAILLSQSAKYPYTAVDVFVWMHTFGCRADVFSLKAIAVLGEVGVQALKKYTLVYYMENDNVLNGETENHALLRRDFAGKLLHHGVPTMNFCRGLPDGSKRLLEREVTNVVSKGLSVNPSTFKGKCFVKGAANFHGDQEVLQCPLDKNTLQKYPADKFIFQRYFVQDNGNLQWYRLSMMRGMPLLLWRIDRPVGENLNLHDIKLQNETVVNFHDVLTQQGMQNLVKIVRSISISAPAVEFFVPVGEKIPTDTPLVFDVNRQPGAANIQKLFKMDKKELTRNKKNIDQEWMSKHASLLTKVLHDQYNLPEKDLQLPLAWDTLEPLVPLNLASQVVAFGLILGGAAEQEERALYEKGCF